MLEQESYFIDVCYDAILDEMCFETRYRFNTKELVEEFNKQITSRYKNILTNDIGYEQKRNITGYTMDEPYRPRFENLEEALYDFEQMIGYCSKYYHVDNSTYKYHSNIFTITIDEYNYKFLIKENEKLVKEIEEIKNNIPSFILNSNLSIEELKEIIEICQNKLNHK